MMKAIFLEEKKGPFLLKNVPIPQPAANEMLIKLSHAALNHRDLWIQKGMYAGLKYPVIPGSDGCGRVDSVGAEVDAGLIDKEVIVNPGMEWGASEAHQSSAFKILGMPDNGTFAEYVVVPANLVHEKPAHLSSAQAASLPLAGVTAFRALFSRGNLKAGEKVLINGIGGGVAQMCLMFAQAAGAEVYVTSGDQEKIDRACQIGAIAGVNYRNETWYKEFKGRVSGFDVIIDSAGGPGFARLLDLANFGGRIVMYGGTLGAYESISPQKLFWKQLSLLGTSMGSQNDFSQMLQFVHNHQLKPMVDQEFALEETELAVERMEKGRQFGKVVLSIK